MATLQKCSKCKSEQELKYFSINKKGQPYKTCDSCRNKRKCLSNKDVLPDNPTKRTFKHCISIDATDIATLLGLHKHKTNIHELVMKYWSRGFASDFIDTREKLKQENIVFVEHKSSDDKIVDICVQKNISMNFELIEDVDVLVEQLSKEDDIDVDEDDITSFCNKQMGIQFEKPAIEKYEETCNSTIDDVREHVKVEEVRKYIKKAFRENDDYCWFVGGRVDGTIDTDKIIEVKNRKKYIFPCIPIYEILQIYTYMYATSITKASLVEMYKDEINVTDFTYTIGYEKFALTRLNKFCDFIEKFINDEKLKERFMKCSVDDTDEVDKINELMIHELDIKHMKNAKITPITDIITKTTEPDISELIMVFDVEHSGTSVNRILQLSWGLYSDDGTLVRMSDFYVKPNEYIEINPYVSKKIRLTYDELLVKENKLPIQELLTKFMDDASKCKIVVSHNIGADTKTMNKELERNGFETMNVQTYCTMKETKSHCNLKDSKNRAKNPSLEELHNKLFGDDMDLNLAHNSSYDVEICAKCYFKYKSL